MSRFPAYFFQFLAVDWDLFSRRPLVKAMAAALAGYNCRLIAINRPLCPFTTAIKKPHRLGQLFSSPAPREIADNLFLYSPRYLLHDGIARKVPCMETANLRALRRELRRIQKHFGVTEPEPIVWYNYPQQGYVSRLFPQGFTIYELYDSLCAVDGSPRPLLDSLEASQRDQVDLLLTTSNHLHKQYASQYRSALMFGNGLTRETFDMLVSNNTIPCEDITGIPSPRLGYAGMISSRLDWNLIDDLAAEHPTWNFIFVGPTDNPSIISTRRHTANIHFFPPCPLHELPSVLKSFDLGIMPYLSNTFFDSLNPLKFYEMAAAGLSMVSSYIPELVEYSDDLIRVVDRSGSGWSEAIEKLLAQDRSQAARIGSEIAGRWIWEDMARGLVDRLQTEYHG